MIKITSGNISWFKTFLFFLNDDNCIENLNYKTTNMCSTYKPTTYWIFIFFVCLKIFMNTKFYFFKIEILALVQNSNMEKYSHYP
jgi:hypothetical protein